jgi:DNA polymerase alpha-associated DNA helicase A
MNQTMSKLQKFSESDYTPLIRVLFGISSPTPVPEDLKGPSEEIESINFIDPTLNHSQKDAIRFAMASKEVALIHGPPGVSTTFPQAYRARS